MKDYKMNEIEFKESDSVLADEMYYTMDNTYKNVLRNVKNLLIEINGFDEETQDYCEQLVVESIKYHKMFRNVYNKEESYSSALSYEHYAISKLDMCVKIASIYR